MGKLERAMRTGQAITDYSSTRRSLLLYWLPAIALTVAISVLSSLSGSTLEEPLDALHTISLNQAVLHATEFGVFTLLA